MLCLLFCFLGVGFASVLFCGFIFCIQQVFLDWFLSHHTSWYFSEISCLIGCFLFLIISHFMLETKKRLDLPNGYRQYPKFIVQKQDWHGKGFNSVKEQIEIKSFGIYFIFFYKISLFDSQMCQIAGCKKEESLCTHSNMLRLTHLSNKFCLWSF